MHNGVITILPTGFPPSDQIPERERCPQEKAVPVGGCLGEGIPSSLGESGKGGGLPRERRAWPGKVRVQETKEEGGGSGVWSGIKITQTCSP